MKIKKITILCVFILFVASCSNVKTTEGNFIFDNKLGVIKAGMNKQELREILGPPTIVSSFNENTWYYMYEVYSKKLRFLSKNNIQSNIVIIKFQNNIISSIDIKSEQDRRDIKYVNTTTVDPLKKNKYKSRVSNYDSLQ